jgi:colicin import membrane protein
MGEHNMVLQDDYRNSLIAAVVFHILLVIMLCLDPSSKTPVLTKTASTNAAPMQQNISNEQHEQQPIQAVSVNQNEVMQTVNRLKQERLNQQRAEENRQRALQQQAEAARQQRLKEQNRLAALRAKQLAEEQKHVKQLAELKKQEEQHRVAMKQQEEKLHKQQQEMQKLAELKQKEDQAKKVALAKKAAQQAAQQAAQNAAKEAQIAGEVNKYKAMILGAIGKQWILPENANSSLSSQFRIRLAPNGAVLSVVLLHSSGDPILDRSAQSAIYKASPLPVPHDVAVFNLFRDINLTVRPVNARG